MPGLRARLAALNKQITEVQAERKFLEAHYQALQSMRNQLKEALAKQQMDELVRGEKR